MTNGTTATDPMGTNYRHVQTTCTASIQMRKRLRKGDERYVPSAIIEADKQGRMHEMDAADSKHWLVIDLCNVIQVHWFWNPMHSIWTHSETHGQN